MQCSVVQCSIVHRYWECSSAICCIIKYKREKGGAGGVYEGKGDLEGKKIFRFINVFLF